MVENENSLEVYCLITGMNRDNTDNLHERLLIESDGPDTHNTE